MGEPQLAEDEKIETVEADNLEEDENYGLDMEDEDLNKAAVKIQSTFRGHKTRSEVIEKKEDNDEIKESQLDEDEKIETVEVDNLEEDENYGLDMEDEDLNK